MKNASIILLEALLQGRPIKLHDRELTLERTEEKNEPIICTSVQRTKLGTNTWETIPIPYDITLSDFIKSAEKLSEEDLIILVGEIVLNKINQKKRN